MTEVAVTRKTVPLTHDEAELVDRARTAGTPQHGALVKLLGVDPSRSEAATLHALLGLALTKLGDEVAEQDYARLAAARDDEDDAFDAALRQRGRDRR